MFFHPFKAFSLIFVLGSLFIPMAHADDAPGAPVPPPTQSDFMSALTNGTPYWEERYRYETVKQGGFANDAQANTLRSILGYKTGVYHYFQADVALLNVAQFGDHAYNDGSDGKTQYPKIGDPGDTQLFIANLAYTELPQTTIVGGRQKVELDNQRWVGAANWRQNAQTFDGVTVDNRSIDNLEIFYGHLFHQNRGPGPNVTNGTYDMNADLFHFAYSGFQDVKLIGYSYLDNVANVHSLSNATTGARVEANIPLDDDWQFTGNAEYARQVNYGDNPNDYSLNYYLIEPGAAYMKLAGKMGHEVLEGNGGSAVQAPMMAPHPMNGWADQFVTIPLNGLEDSYVDVSYRLQLPCAWLDETEIEGAFHNFNANHVDQHYGDEYDLDFMQKIASHYSIDAQFADYKADKLLTDSRKIVVMLQLDF